MSDIDEDLKNWLEDKLIPELKSSLNITKCKVQYVISDITGTVFMARVYFVDLKFFNYHENMENEINLVVKRPALGNLGRNVIHLDAAYHNEILFYTKFEKFHNHYPKVFYTFEKPPYDSVIVTENINPHGYFQYSEKGNFDLDHIYAAFRELAKLHANGYIMKHKNPVKFFEITQSLQPHRNLDAESSYYIKNTKFLNSRVIKFLRKQNYDETFCKKFEIFLSTAFEYTNVELQKPVEPLATLCHGDFIKWNIFYKKSKDSLEAQLIDFGLLNYGSPCRDIAHFLYLNGTRSHRTDQFFEIFDVYYKSLIQYLKDGGLTNFEQYSKDAFLEDYKVNAIFGYTICLLVLPITLGLSKYTPEVMLTSPDDKVRQVYEEIGGDEFTELLVQMILDLREAGSLDFINDISVE